MMKSTLKNKGILYIVLLALVVLAYLFSDFATKDSEDEIAAHIQMQLQSDDLLLDEIMLDLQEVLLINGQQAYEQKSLDYQRKYKDRFAFFLYHDHQLELWTDNHIPLPINDSLFTHQKLQQFGSYQLLLKKHEFHHFNMMGLQVLKLKYPWQNDYLTNHIAPYFKISSEIIVDNKDGIPILDNKGNSLFFITLQESKTSDHLKMLAFALFIASFFLLAISISLALSQLAKKKALLSLIIFSMLLSFWFLIHRYLSLPNHLFNSSLFSSALYANASIQNSLGNLFFISLILLLIVIYYLNHIKGKTRHWGLIYLYLPLSYVLYFGMILILRSLVFDSQIPLNLHQIASLDNNSYIALTIIFINQLSWLILLIRWLYYFSQDKKSELHFWILLIILSLSPLLIPKDYFSYFLILQLFFSLILILVFYIQRTENRHYNLIKILLYIILFTSITTWYLNKLEDEKERQFRKTSAVTLDMENDPFLENYFLHVLGDISSDQQVLGVLRDQELTNTDDSLFNIINDHYFEKFKSTYNFNLIHCYENSVINIPPDETEWPCYKYFQQKVENQWTKYKYRIKEFGQDWIELGTRHEIGFQSLKPGEYHLEVTASDHGKDWNEDIFKLKIIVQAYFWQTRWFWMIFSLIMIISASLIVRSRFKNIKSQKQRIEALVNIRTKELQTANLELKKANETKDHFFTIISHDLKNPIGAAKSVSHELKENFKDYNADDQQEFLNILDKSINSLANLLKDLLTWSRMQQEDIVPHPEEVILLKCVNRTLEVLSQNIQKKELEIKIDISEDLLLWVDKNILSTIIRNLLSNAIKFTPNGGQISISTLHSSQEIIIQFKDNGIGIPDDVLKKLFIPGGVMSHPGTNNEKGTGMGLVLLKEFIDLCNGEIWVESTVGKGSVFFVSLPAYLALSTAK